MFNNFNNRISNKTIKDNKYINNKQLYSNNNKINQFSFKLNN